MLKAIDDNKNLVAIYDNSEIDLNIKNAVNNRAKTDLSNVENPVFKAKVIESGYQSLHLGDYISSAEDIQSIDPDFLRCDGSLIKKSDYPYIYQRFKGYNTQPIVTATAEPIDVSKLSELGKTSFSYTTSHNMDSMVFNQSKTRAICSILARGTDSNNNYILLFDTSDWSILKIIDTTKFNSQNIWMNTSVSFAECGGLSPFIFTDDETIFFTGREIEKSSTNHIEFLYKTKDFFETVEKIDGMSLPSYWYSYTLYGFGESPEGIQFVMWETNYTSGSTYRHGIYYMSWNKNDFSTVNKSYNSYPVDCYLYFLKIGDTWLTACGAYPYSSSVTKHIRTVENLYRLNFSSGKLALTSFTYPTDVKTMSVDDKMTKFLYGATYYRGKYIFGDRGSNSYVTTDFINYERFTQPARTDYWLAPIYDCDVNEYPTSNALFIDNPSCGRTNYTMYTAYQENENDNGFVWSNRKTGINLSALGISSSTYIDHWWVDGNKLKIIAINNNSLAMYLVTYTFTDFKEYINVPGFSDTMSGFSDNDYVKRNFEGKKYLYIKAR